MDVTRQKDWTLLNQEKNIWIKCFHIILFTEDRYDIPFFNIIFEYHDYMSSDSLKGDNSYLISLTQSMVSNKGFSLIIWNLFEKVMYVLRGLKLWKVVNLGLIICVYVYIYTHTQMLLSEKLVSVIKK